jgi:hypothetical protein
MDTDQRGKILGGLTGLAAGLSPMKSVTFLLALGVAAVAAWVWFKQSGDPRPPFPRYGIIAVSYAGGFIIGRLFWKIVKTAAILAALVLGGLALLHYARVDDSKARQAVANGSTWVQDEVGRAKHYLLHLLPSGGAAGVGVFAGARRRRSSGDDQPR